ncbi:MAG TPA: hypothetical protein VFI47_04310 [Acidimicrobiales bacterium]|nr:hypothetical protein [Acidimicrobiales bacterium]
MNEFDWNAGERPPDGQAAAPPRVPGLLRAAAVASLGAGAIHATAAGSHSEHRSAVVAFAVVAVLQIGWGALALARSGGLVSLAGIAVNGAAVGGWVLAKTSGISFITGLDVKESPELADTLCASLGAVAVLGALAALATGVEWISRPHPGLVGLAAVATLSVAVPGMVATGEHGHGGGTHASGEHDMAGMDHGHGSAQPKPYDATLPVDLSGVEGVSAAEQKEAEDLLTETLQILPGKFSDPAKLPAMGWYPIGDAVTGFEHFINWPLIDDGITLDPDKPESIVYEVLPDGTRKLVAAMFIEPRDVTLENAPDFGGDLIQWHSHTNLCYGGEPNKLMIRAVVEYPAPCPGDTFRDHLSPMIHVWVTPHECGPFAALEGEGGGVIAPGEEKACDHAHGAPPGATDPAAQPS